MRDAIIDCVSTRAEEYVLAYTKTAGGANWNLFLVIFPCIRRV